MDQAMASANQSNHFDAELFFDHVYNAAYDIFEDSFDTLEENVPLLLGNPSEDTMKATTRGFDAVFNTLQEKLEKYLNRWEEYCRTNCFTSPVESSSIKKNFSLLKATHHPDTVSEEEQLDAELESVRSELHSAGKESARIRRELRNLERFLAIKKKHEDALQDAVVQLKDEEHHDMLEELVNVANLLKEKLTKVKPERIQSPRGVRWTGHAREDLDMLGVESVVKTLNL